MDSIQLKRIDQLLFYLQDYNELPFYSFRRKCGLRYFYEILNEIENIFPQLQILKYEDFDFFKTRYIFHSNETKKILGHIDIEGDETVYEIVCKIIRTCEDYINQHTIVKSNDTVLQVHHCVSCGATLKRGSYKCEYCDTEYW